MGGRKRTFKILKKPKPMKPRAYFDCAVCGWKDCIIIKIKKGYKTAKLECERCETKFDMKVRSLDEPIDIYHEWLHKLKTKAITPYPNRMQDEYDDTGDEANENDVEQLLKNQKGKKNTRKRIKRNASDEEISAKNDKVSDSEEALDEDQDISEDSLLNKQKVEDNIDDNQEDEKENDQEDEKDDSEDESFNIKEQYKRKRGKKK
ncbi:unnamed protein product [Paramecium octaurelia]|uniref:Transcription elongation factor 1 homolog n=1 Tax=Paramecium octaurelia TaxID=43137 RepID=A0A8S1V6H5_PAROT|nr:unnamed protein product [Paramecium octaurelia]